MTFPQSVLSCLFMGNRDFIYKRSGSRNFLKRVNRKRQKLSRIPINMWEWKPFMAARLKWNTLAGKRKQLTAACLKWLKFAKNVKILQSEIKSDYNNWAHNTIIISNFEGLKAMKEHFYSTRYDFLIFHHPCMFQTFQISSRSNLKNC